MTLLERQRAGSQAAQLEEIERHNQRTGQHLPPPHFWDNLSRIPLVKRALCELDRRNIATRALEDDSEVSRQSPGDPRQLKIDIGYEEIKRFSRHGGPDLSNLRGFTQEHTMWSQDSRPTNRLTRTSARTGPYDPAFAQHLLDHKILPLEYMLIDWSQHEPPDNMREIQAELAAVRAFEPAEDFQSFQRAYGLASNEEDALNQIDTLEGDRVVLLRSHAIRQKKMMSKLAALTDGSLVPGNPDRVYGAYAAELTLSIRERLKDLVVPTAEQDFICPNFVVHVKGITGNMAAARVQALYDGALAARGMQALWDFGGGLDDDIASGEHTRGAGEGSDSTAILASRSQRLSEPGAGLVGHSRVARVARTLTCTWVGGILKIYTIHCEFNPDIRDGPLAGNLAAGAPRYVPTLVGSWIMTDREDQFREGLAAYRNGLDWAKRQRDTAVNRANARAQVEDARRRREEEKDLDKGNQLRGEEVNFEEEIYREDSNREEDIFA